MANWIGWKMAFLYTWHETFASKCYYCFRIENAHAMKIHGPDLDVLWDNFRPYKLNKGGEARAWGEVNNLISSRGGRRSVSHSKKPATPHHHHHHHHILRLQTRPVLAAEPMASGGLSDAIATFFLCGTTNPLLTMCLRLLLTLSSDSSESLVPTQRSQSFQKPPTSCRGLIGLSQPLSHLYGWGPP